MGHHLRMRSRLAAVLMITMSPAFIAPAAMADETTTPAPTPTTPTTANSTVLAANAYPGVQLIETTYKATVSLPEPAVDEYALAKLGQRIYNQAAAGMLDDTQEAVAEEIVSAIETAPNTYLYPSAQTYTKRMSLTGTGTGWVISPDGYMITAAHVVSASEKELAQEFASEGLARIATAFVRSAQKSGGGAFTPAQTDRMAQAVMEWSAQYISVDNLNVSVSAAIALGFDGLGKSQKPVSAEVVDVGKPYPGNDVALLKIDGQEHLPTIPMGENSDVSPGSTVHVVGFPAASTYSPGMSDDAMVQPTVTEGPITAIKSTSTGMPVFQTQAPASPGNSGGPVLDDNGDAVGVLVASAVDDGVAAQGQMFVIPVSEVLDMLEQNGVTASTSDTSTTYAKAVSEYYASHYKAAVPLFEEAEALYPAHPFTKKFISDSKVAISQGDDKTPAPKKDEGPGLGLWLGIGGGIVALALIGAGAYWLTRRKGSREQHGPAGGMTPVPGSMPPPAMLAQGMPAQGYGHAQGPGQPWPQQGYQNYPADPGQGYHPHGGSPGQQYPATPGHQYPPQQGAYPPAQAQPYGEGAQGPQNQGWPEPGRGAHDGQPPHPATTDVGGGSPAGAAGGAPNHANQGAGGDARDTAADGPDNAKGGAYVGGSEGTQTMPLEPGAPRIAMPPDDESPALVDPNRPGQEPPAPR